MFFSTKNSCSTRLTGRFSYQLLTIVSALLVASSVQADEASVSKTLNSLPLRLNVAQVKKAGYGNLYEVQLKNGQLIYTDEKVSFLLNGELVDPKNGRNITEERVNELNKINFSDLPLSQAIKVVNGNGKRVLATFEDPNCGYCKKLAKELQNVKDVTVYTFLLPILSADSMEKSKNIWCAKDRATAWNDWMLSGRVPAAATCDTSAIEKNLALAQKYKIHGTPSIFLTDGQRIPGFVPAAQLEKLLDR